MNIKTIVYRHGLTYPIEVDNIRGNGVDYSVERNGVMILRSAVRVEINGKVFKFGRGTRWNGATIPKHLHWLLGGTTNPKFALASLVHDMLYDLLYDRDVADMVFRLLLRRAGVGAERAAIMWAGVRVGGYAYYQAYTRRGKFWKFIRNRIYKPRAV